MKNVQSELINDINTISERTLLRYLTPCLLAFVNDMRNQFEADKMRNEFRRVRDWGDSVKKEKRDLYYKYLTKNFPHFNLKKTLKARIVSGVCVHNAGQLKTCAANITVSEEHIHAFVYNTLREMSMLISEEICIFEQKPHKKNAQLRELAALAVDNAVVDLITSFHASQIDVAKGDDDDEIDNEDSNNNNDEDEKDYDRNNQVFPSDEENDEDNNDIENDHENDDEDNDENDDEDNDENDDENENDSGHTGASINDMQE